MIEKITFIPNKKISRGIENKTNPIVMSGLPKSENYKNLPSGTFLHSYFVSNNISFKGKDILSYKERLKSVKDNMTPKAIEVYKESQNLAKRYKHDSIQQIHGLYVISKMILGVIDKIDKGDLDILHGQSISSIGDFENIFGSDVFSDDKKREIFKKVLTEQIKVLEKKLKQMPKSKNSTKTPEFSKAYLQNIFTSYEKDNTPDADGQTEGDGYIGDSFIFTEALASTDDKIKKEIIKPYLLGLSEKLMTYRKETPAPMEFYEDKGREIWKNLNVGTNMFILSEPEMETDYMVDTFESILKDKNKTFGKFNAKNTKIFRYNKYANVDFILDGVKKGVKDKDNNYVFVYDYNYVNINDSDAHVSEIERYIREKQKYPNLHFVLLSKKDDYYDRIIKDCDYKDFSQVTIPIINIENAKKMFRKEKSLMSEIKKEFSSKAVDKIIEASDKLDGYFPKKAQTALGLVASCYVDKDKISEKDAIEYIKQAKDFFKTNNDDSSATKVILDTEVRLKDLVGLKTTKKEALSIIKQIKNRSIGTKGFIIYSQDGSPGAGRNYTARAIAGEAKIPFLEINAIDFGTKDVNIFAESSSSTPESAMKKLFSMAKANAENNKSKALLLYIQNFEYFSCGDRVSEYHEKAMSQLLKEMDAAQKQGLNIVVMGSVSSPDLIGESTEKSFKFVDKIEVESPQLNKDARKELIEHFMKKKKIKLNTQNELEKDVLLNHFADITEYHSLLGLMTLVDKFKNVAIERGHKIAEKSDFIEAFMQIACGRPNVNNAPKYSKEITACHEFGHAVTGLLMNNITKKLKPWNEAERVSFITLDPRSNYLAAVYYNSPENQEYTLERILSNIISSFGGYSCEKHFYGIDGSWGITGDMKSATNSATTAVAVMGVGYNFGKKSLNGAAFIDDEDKAKINKDIDILLKNSQFISDLIVDQYEDLIKLLTQKYAEKVGTGDCIIPVKEFKEEVDKWKSSLPEEKLKDLSDLEEIIVDIIQKTKCGEYAEERYNKK